MRNILAHFCALSLIFCLVYSPHIRAATTAKLEIAEIANMFETAPGQPWVLSAQSLSRSLQPKNGLWDLRGCAELTLQARVKKTGPGAVHLRWIVKSRIGGLFTTVSTESLPEDRSALQSVGFQESSSNLVPAGHQRPWDALAAAEVESIELHADYAFSGSANSGVSLTLTNAGLADAVPPALVKAELRDLAVHLAPANYRAAACVDFRIEPEPQDPYSPDGEGDVRVKLSGGGEVLAFLQQEQNLAREGLTETRYAASKKPYWRAYIPELPATGGLEIISGGRHWNLTPKSIAALTVPDEQNVEESEPGERWRVPLRVAMPSHRETWGRAPAAWKLDASGEWKAQPANSIKASALWRPVPFWNAAWGGFGGEARPNDALAQSMESMLAHAAASGRTLPLVILDGEAFDRQGTFNWESHPLRGELSGPGEMLSSERGLAFSRRVMRYCIARWGMSKAVSSLCMTAEINSPLAPKFHASLAGALKTLGATALPDADMAGGSGKTTLPILSLHPLARPPEKVRALDPFGGFERATAKQDGWQPESDSTHTIPIEFKEFCPQEDSPVEFRAAQPDCLAVGVIAKCISPGSDYQKAQPDDFSAADSLLFDVLVPADAPSDLRLGVHLRDRDGFWFEAMLPGLARPGDWTAYALDLTGSNAQQLTPIQHKKAWTDYSRQRIREVGLHVYSVHKNWTPPNSKNPVALSAKIRNIRAVRFERNEPDAPVLMTLVDPSGQLNAPSEALKVDSNPTTHVEYGELWQCHFSCNKTFSNPFDVRVCDINAVIVTPSGKTLRIPAFFDQLCERREATPGGAEIVEPLGREFFTVRYRPLESGEYRIRLELREGGTYEVKTDWQPDPRFTPAGEPQVANGFLKDATPTYPTSFSDGRRKIDQIKFVPGQVSSELELKPLTVGETPTVAEQKQKGSKAFRGYVRVASDNRHFQYDDGSFYYPLGPCLRSPSDWRLPYGDKKWTNEEINRIAGRGTYQFDDYFGKFEKAGITWARMWMCSWWCGLEWRRDWPGYQGLGRYNLQNAWRMDYVLEEAEKRGIRMEVNLTNHGQLSLMVDTEWKESPYNKELGGPFAAPSEFFTRAEAKIAHRNKLRYILARFGHSPAIMAWELLSEMEYCEEYAPALVGMVDTDRLAPNINAWHSEMATFLKSNDPNHRLVTTHSAQAKHAERVFSLPEIDFSTSNAYSATWPAGEGRDDASQALSDFWAGARGKHEWLKGFARLKKPAIVQEQGAHWEGVEPNGKVNNTKLRLDTDLHAEMWGSMVQPLAGATGYWWWLHLHFDDRYETYKALANFMEGEDMRAAAGESMLEPVFRKVDDDLLGRAIKSDRRLYAWVYHRKTPYGPEVPTISDSVMHIGGLKEGKYKAEFWDTYAGAVMETREVEVKSVDGKAQAFELPMPPVKRDLALKIKPVGK